MKSLNLTGVELRSKGNDYLEFGGNVRIRFKAKIVCFSGKAK